MRYEINWGTERRPKGGWSPTQEAPGVIQTIKIESRNARTLVRAGKGWTGVASGKLASFIIHHNHRDRITDSTFLRPDVVDADVELAPLVPHPSCP